jgi:hypothetical protein
MFLAHNKARYVYAQGMLRLTHPRRLSRPAGRVLAGKPAAPDTSRRRRTRKADAMLLYAIEQVVGRPVDKVGDDELRTVSHRRQRPERTLSSR